MVNTWTPRQQVGRQHLYDGGTQVAVDLTYTYNARGQVSTITDGVDAGNNRVYAYDDLGRLLSATGPWGSGTFDIDPLGNLRAKTLGPVTDTITFNSVTNRATSHTRTGQSARSIQYNETLDRGNVTTLGGMLFTYDYADQPVLQTGTVGAEYRYDGNKRRAYQKIVNDEIYSFYDFSGALVHRDNVSATPDESVNYIAGGGTVVRLEDGGSGYAVREYTYADHLGSPIAATGNSSTITWTERYKPYGEKIIDPPANRDEPGFTSHIQDDATGLTYMQARFYDPMIGRFLSIDPKLFSPKHTFSFNRYAYVGNDPVNAFDPFGLDSFFISRDSTFGFSEQRHSFILGTNVAADGTHSLRIRATYGSRNRFGGGGTVNLTNSNRDVDRTDRSVAEQVIRSLNGPNVVLPEGTRAVQINASDSVVDALIDAVEDNPDYDLHPELFDGKGINSNTNPAAIAVRASQIAGSEFQLPAGQNLPGTSPSSIDQVKFDEEKLRRNPEICAAEDTCQ